MEEDKGNNNQEEFVLIDEENKNNTQKHSIPESEVVIQETKKYEIKENINTIVYGLQYLDEDEESEKDVSVNDSVMQLNENIIKVLNNVLNEMMKHNPTVEPIYSLKIADCDVLELSLADINSFPSEKSLSTHKWSTYDDIGHLRNIDEEHISNLKRKILALGFKPLLGTIVVIFKDGDFYVVDGNHRLKVLDLIASDTELSNMEKEKVMKGLSNGSAKIKVSVPKTKDAKEILQLCLLKNQDHKLQLDPKLKEFLFILQSMNTDNILQGTAMKDLFGLEKKPKNTKTVVEEWENFNKCFNESSYDAISVHTYKAKIRQGGNNLFIFHNIR